MNDTATLKRAEREFHEAEEAAASALTDAMCDTYKQVTGKQPGDYLRREIWYAVRFANR